MTSGVTSLWLNVLPPSKLVAPEYRHCALVSLEPLALVDPNHPSTTWSLPRPPAMAGITLALRFGVLTWIGGDQVTPWSWDVNSHRLVVVWSALVLPADARYSTSPPSM